MMITRLTLLFATIMATCSPKFGFAQDQEVLKSRVLAAARRSTVSLGDLPPYRLEALLTIYDGAGKHPADGTLEILRSGRNTRLTIRFPAGSSVTLSAAAGDYSANVGSLPYFAPRLVRALQDPVEYSGFESDGAQLPSDSSREGALDCAALVETSGARITGVSKLTKTVCINKKDQVQSVVDGDAHFLFDNVMPFDHHDVARRLRLQVGGVTVGEAIITSLATEKLAADSFTPTPDMKTTASARKVAASVMQGKILKHENPKYPGIAKAAHIQGVVLLHAVIDKAGHIQDLSIISSPDDSLSQASMKAVKKWLYEPYLLNGQPTEVDTTITVNFAMGTGK